MRVLSIHQIKGGVGKTTLTALLGAYWSCEGKKVLWIDADPQGALSLLYGTRNANGQDISTLRDVFQKGVRLQDAIIPIRDNISILLGGLSTQGMEDDIHLKQRENVLWDAVIDNAAVLGFDILMVDLPAGIGMLARSMANCSSAVLLPTTPDLPAMSAIGRTLSVIGNTAPRWVILNRMDKSSMSKSSQNAVERAFGKILLSPGIADKVAIRKMMASGILPGDKKGNRVQGQSVLNDISPIAKTLWRKMKNVR